jgi:SAM-dependent methyltransferase
MRLDKKTSESARKPAAPTSWDSVALWYDGWVGDEGSEHHRELAIPSLMSLLDPQPGERILDVGCGQGVLAPHIVGRGAHYTGVDAGPRLLQIARRRHGAPGRFLLSDARDLANTPGLREGEFDAVVFLLSIQDMDPLDRVLASAAWALKPDGRLVMLLTHPAFRVPRQSGWGWDERRRLHYRRVDRYLTPLAVPMKTLPVRKEKRQARARSQAARVATRSFHRPLGAYINSLASCGLLVEQMDEIPAHRANAPPERKDSADRARREFPLFLALRARKLNT